jgi:protein phosphatase
MAIGVTAPLPQLTAKARTDGGRKRDHNEDKYSTYLVDGSSGFFIVADGMGGHAAGEVASQMAIQEITQSATAGWNRMAQGGSPDAARGYINAWITKANQKIFALGQAKRNNMGTTLTAAFVANGQVYAANVGDSRTYLVREGQLYPLTRDHSLVASLVQAGLLEPEAVYNHPQRNEIFRSLGQQSDVNVDVFEPVPLQPGDRLLLCSDGLWEMVRESEMQEILARNPDPQSACNELTRVANEHGGEDNITVVLAQFARG